MPHTDSSSLQNSSLSVVKHIRELQIVRLVTSKNTSIRLRNCILSAHETGNNIKSASDDLDSVLQHYYGVTTPSNLDEEVRATAAYAAQNPVFKQAAQVFGAALVEAQQA